MEINFLTVGVSRTPFYPGCCRYLATTGARARLGELPLCIRQLGPYAARTNFDPRSHDLRSSTTAD